MKNPKNTPEHLRATWSDRYVVSDRGCHEWSLARFDKGYGKTRLHGRSYRAHRAAYELFVGPIPEGQVVRHRCDNPCCVNPEHLELGTQADNVQDRMERGRWSGTPPALTGALWPIFLKRLSELGLSHSRLAEKFGVGASTIGRAIKRAPKGKMENTRRERPGRQGLPGPDWPIFLKKLNELGLSQRRLAKKFGVSQSTISRTLQRAHPTT